MNSSFELRPSLDRQNHGGRARRQSPIVTALTLAGVVALFSVSAAKPAASNAAAETRPAAVAQGEAWTVQQCAECHDVQVAAIGKGPHAALNLADWSKHAGIDGSCAGCHGDPAEHLASEGEAELYSFGKNASADAERCLTCHQKDHPQFKRSPHARTGMGCTDCHDVHRDRSVLADIPAALRGRDSALCVNCHVEVATQFTFNEHHRLEEGAIECTSCHNPHQPQARVALGAFKQQLCVECHTDKGGPFVFEHPASAVEGCVSCHSPHGSPNRHMLAFSQTAEVCFSCHAEVPGFHTRFTLDTQCTNCHSQIHGSNLNHAFLK